MLVLLYQQLSKERSHDGVGLNNGGIGRHDGCLLAHHVFKYLACPTVLQRPLLVCLVHFQVSGVFLQLRWHRFQWFVVFLYHHFIRAVGCNFNADEVAFGLHAVEQGLLVGHQMAFHTPHQLYHIVVSCRTGKVYQGNLNRAFLGCLTLCAKLFAFFQKRLNALVAFQQGRVYILFGQRHKAQGAQGIFVARLVYLLHQLLFFYQALRNIGKTTCTTMIIAAAHILGRIVEKGKVFLSNLLKRLVKQARIKGAIGQIFGCEVGVKGYFRTLFFAVALFGVRHEVVISLVETLPIEVLAHQLHPLWGEEGQFHQPCSIYAFKHVGRIGV